VGVGWARHGRDAAARRECGEVGGACGVVGGVEGEAEVDGEEELELERVELMQRKASDLRPAMVLHERVFIREEFGL
jgi:hypothetical protein